jgi:hypothetical protein
MESYTSRRSTPDGGEELMYRGIHQRYRTIIAGSGYGLLIEYFMLCARQPGITQDYKGKSGCGRDRSRFHYTDASSSDQTRNGGRSNLGCHSQWLIS